MARKRRSPSVSDHGGASYPRVRSVKRSKTNTLSFRCRDCSKLRYIRPIELDRASTPRCLNCGGLLLETKATEGKRIKKHDAQRLRQARGEIKTETTKGLRCKCCRVKFNGGKDLERHFWVKRECLHFYNDEGLTQSFQGQLALADTFEVEWFGSSGQYIVRAILPNGRYVSFFRHKSKQHCLDLLEKEVGKS